MLSEFHFLSPEWFLALLPLGAILWGIGRRGTGAGAWQRVVDPNLLPHLLVQGRGKGGRLPMALLAAGWLTAVVALANPTFERLPVPVYRGELARVVVLDLSRSMETADLEPSRLARARYKVADILERSRDGQVGLIAFAGEAFVVSPLTDDADTILAMFDALVPDIMPVQGSHPDLALAEAGELLAQAGASRGEVVLVGDDAGGPRALAQAKALKAAGHSLSVIGVGTAEGAPIPGVRGSDERAVISRLDTVSMQALAAAGGGVYAPLSADGRDLDLALRATPDMPDQGLPETQVQTEAWKELGPWVLLLVLPFGALAFRRGWLLALALVVGSWAQVPEPAMASGWEDLWQRRDQQAAAALEQGEHKRALDLAEQPQRRGTASYRLGDYEAAAEAFAAVDQADAHYNRGNALARSGRLEEAVAAYGQALSQEPEMEDAAHNKALIEELLKQQQEEQSRGDRPQEQPGEQSGQQQSEDQSQASQEAGDQSGQTGQPSDGQPQDTGADQPGESDRSQDSDGQQESDRQQQADRQEQESAAGEEQASEQESGRAGEPPHAPGEEPAVSGADEEPGHRADPGPAEPLDAEETERAAADYREQAAEHEEERALEPPSPPQGEPSAQEREERQAADQWLRRIPDDPAGLLRRKFLYQYRTRAVQEGVGISGDPW